MADRPPIHARTGAPLLPDQYHLICPRSEYHLFPYLLLQLNGLHLAARALAHLVHHEAANAAREPDLWPESTALWRSICASRCVVAAISAPQTSGLDLVSPTF